MAIPPDIPLPCRIIALEQERNRLFGYPLESLADEIRLTGFRCNACGTCCTRAVNRHIFLLDRDVANIMAIDPGAFEPAPDPEFCDQNGTLYVSGYALRMKNEAGGTCWFLSDGRCRIYDRRFSVCRIYPHMLRRKAGLADTKAWCTFSRMHEHGRYHEEIPEDECRELAREIKEYENAFLTQQISFLEQVHHHFTTHELRHVPAMHERQMQRYSRGANVRLLVYHAGELVEQSR
jgi:Fe-S-cluster containining protein